MGSMTTIAGQVLNADGRPARGQVVISWPFFQVPGQDYVGGETTFKIVDGNLSIALQSNQDAQPLGMFYTATFELDSGQVYQEYWIVPSRTTATMGQCRVSVPDSPSVIISPLQLGSLGALPNQFLQWNGTRWVPGFASSLNFSPITIGFLIGSTGNDVNVVGSPASLGGNLQLNIPDASPTARGVVTTGPQTFAGDKTFTGTTTVSDLMVTGNVSSPAGFPVTWAYGGPVFGIDIGQRPKVNFYPGSSNVAISMTDDPVGNQMLIEIDAVGGGGGGGMIDPTLALGDLIVRGSLAIERLPRGTDGQILMAVPTTQSPLGVGWVNASTLQTPWLGNVDAAGHSLDNVGNLNVSTINGITPGLWSQSPAPPGAIYYNGGNVGVGTATPSQTFTVINHVSPAFGIASTRYASDAVPPIIYEYKARGTEANPQPIQANDWIGYIGFGAWLGPGVALDGAAIDCIVTSVSGTSLTADLLFLTNDGGSVGNVGERMRITSTGNVGIGTATPGVDLLHLHGASDLRFYLGGPDRSYIGTEGTRLELAADGTPGVAGYGGIAIMPGTGNVGIAINTPVARLQANVNNAWVPVTTIGVANMGVVAVGAFGGGIGMVDIPYSNRTLALWSIQGHLNFGFGDMGLPFTERMVLTRDGNLGINQSFDRAVDPLTVGGVGVGGQIRMVYGNYGVIFRSDGGSFYLMKTAVNDPYGIWGSIPLCMDLASGNIGIGVLAPVFALDVVSPIRIRGGGGDGFAGVWYDSGWGDRRFFSGTDSSIDSWRVFSSSGVGNILTVHASGHVGINTGVPDQALTVNGNCNISGTYFVNGAPLTTGPANFRGGGPINQVHQNQTGKPLYVTISGHVAAPVTWDVYCDGGNPPGTLVGRGGSLMANVWNQYDTVHFVVLPGWYYNVVGAAGQVILDSWAEWY